MYRFASSTFKKRKYEEKKCLLRKVFFFILHLISQHTRDGDTVRTHIHRKQRECGRFPSQQCQWIHMCALCCAVVYNSGSANRSIDSKLRAIFFRWFHKSSSVVLTTIDFAETGSSHIVINQPKEGQRSGLERLGSVWVSVKHRKLKRSPVKRCNTQLHNWRASPSSEPMYTRTHHKIEFIFADPAQNLARPERAFLFRRDRTERTFRVEKFIGNLPCASKALAWHLLLNKRSPFPSHKCRRELTQKWPPCRDERQV